MLENSYERDEIRLSTECGEALKEMINVNYKMIYKAEVIRRYEANANNVIEGLFTAVYGRVRNYIERSEEKPDSGVICVDGIVPSDRLDSRLLDYIKEKAYEKGTLPEQITVDYIAGMTDAYALSIFEELYWL